MQNRWKQVCWIVLLWSLPGIAWGWTSFFIEGYCQTSGQECRSTVGNAGGAGACCDPASPDIKNCIVNDPCVGAYEQKWDTSDFPLKWSMNANQMAGKAGFPKLTEAILKAELLRAWNVWSGPACTSFQHQYQGPTTSPPDYHDGKITIYLASEAEWAQLGQSIGGALAFASPRSNDQGRLLDGDVIVNPKPVGGNWGVNPVPANEYDLTAAISHEIGHSLGLGHTPLTSALMYFTIKGQGDTFTGLGADDRDGICSLYPKTNACQSDADCAPCFSCSGNQCTTQSPAIAKLCQPCTNNADCGTGSCVATAEGNRCLQKCSGCCPAGYRCERVAGADHCVPMTGQCPATKCTVAADCGAGGACTNGTCTSATPANTKACSIPCLSSIDCGPDLLCHSFGNGNRRCLFPCVSDAFCPVGYSCQKLTSGSKSCVPNAMDFCPCTAVADCATGEVCRDNLCQQPQGGTEGAACNDKVPCQTGFRCVGLSTGNKCLRDCFNSPCPANQLCQTSGINRKFCIGQATQKAGESCDGIVKRCLDGLACVQHTNTTSTGICAQRCQLSTECPTGDVCTNSDTGVRYCGCRNNSDCSDRKLPCVNAGGGYKMCLCTNPPCGIVCGNGLCEVPGGESCASCQADCGCKVGESCVNKLCKAAPDCGDGTCDAAKNENCSTCAADCQCSDSETCESGVCRPASGCGDGLCDNKILENCTSCQQDCPCPTGLKCDSGTCQPTTTKECGNGVCSVAVGESCTTCPEDCGCKDGQQCEKGVCRDSAPCGDGTCEAARGENCGTCLQDCPCQVNESCQANSCKANATPVVTGQCGDGICTISEGEDCTSCPKDCGCKDRKICTRGACVSADSLCPPAAQNLKCDANGANCTLSCQQTTACGCQAPADPYQPLPLLLLLIGLVLVRRSSSLG